MIKLRRSHNLSGESGHCKSGRFMTCGGCRGCPQDVYIANENALPSAAGSQSTDPRSFISTTSSQL